MQLRDLREWVSQYNPKFRTVEVDTSKSPSHYGSGSCATYSAQDIYISTCDTEFPVKQEQTEVDHQEFCLHWIVWGLILPIDLAHRSCPLILPIDLAPLTSCPFTPILNMPAEDEDEAQDSDPPGLETDLQWRWDWTIKILNRCRPYRWMDLTRARQFWTWGWWS